MGNISLTHTSRRSFSHVPLLLLILLLSLIASTIVSGETFVNDPSNEDALIVPNGDEASDGEEESGGCDGGSDNSDGDVIRPASPSDDDFHGSDGYEKWDEHFAKERAKQKLQKSSRPALVPSSRRRFGFRDRSFMPSSISPFASLFRRRPKMDDSFITSNDRDADFASSDGVADATPDYEDDSSSLMESSSNPLPARFARTRPSGSRWKSRRNRQFQTDDDFEEMQNFQPQHQPEDHDDEYEDQIQPQRFRGRTRNRPLFRNKNQRFDMHSPAATVRPRRKFLFG
jgi:hypothetical protein